MAKELLFSVSAKDCDWNFFRSSGPGGQNVNKVSSGARCKHKESGAVGESTRHRDQPRNKKEAFLKMINTKEFKKWHSLECARRLGHLKQIEEKVERQMQPKNIKTEIKDHGKWKVIKDIEEEDKFGL